MAEVPGPRTPDEVDHLREALAAERAGAEHWRNVARHREAALAELKGRTIIRALLYVDRRTGALRAGAKRLRADARERAAAWAVPVAALPTSIEARDRRRALDDLLAADGSVRPAEPSTASPKRSGLVVVTGVDTVPPPLAHLASPDRVRVVAATDEAAAARVAAAAVEDLVCFVAASTEPLSHRWLDRLAAAVTGDVVAATSVLLHPERPVAVATPHDLRVRSGGLEVRVSDDGAPRVEARHAGRAPAPAPAEPSTVAAATAGALVVDRAALARSGGLRPTGSPDVSMVDLCLRLRADGGRVVCVPDIVAFDHRPITRLAQLTEPLDRRTPEWRALVARQGPRLRRAATGGGDPATFAVTVGCPTRKVADRWGDWHLAEALARALQQAGRPVRVQTLAEVDDDASRSADVQLVLRGLAPVRRTVGQHHVLWIISHPEDLDDRELDDADLVLVASHRFAAALRHRTSTPVEVLLQATDHERFRPVPPVDAHRHDVTVVGKSRDVLRPMVRDAVAAGLRPAIYGTGWDGFVEEELMMGDHVDNHELATIYSSAGVVLNDHWDTMRRWGFVSNRVFDVLACGTPLVSDHLPEITDLFGELVPMWRAPGELGDLVRSVLDDPEGARARARRAREIVLAEHTFTVRATQLIEAIARSGAPPAV